ncbi:MAG: aminotransferase class V-fold PLP-dependent enzyme [Saprospiraceae bacterium]|nr:aminotransferase class V-fold PLP-dependent enzyme [Saprospiraceae bacterium]
MNLECQKELFTLTEGIHYFNCASKSPLLKSAELLAVKAVQYQRHPFHLKDVDFFSEVENVKEEFAKLINTSKNNIAIIPSVSYGFASMLKNVSPKDNGHALTIRDEFPSGYYALEKWCIDNSNSLKIVNPILSESEVGKSWNHQVIESINDDTSVVLMSAIHWINGLKFDIQAIGKKCKNVGAKLLIDGTQMLGAMPFDISKYDIDGIVCGGYKWLFGPYSVALAYFDDAFFNGKPIEESWMNRVNARDFKNLTNYNDNYLEGASRYCVGETSNFILMAILLEGLKQVNEWTPYAIQNYCAKLMSPVREIMIKKGLYTEAEAFSVNHILSMQLPSSIDPTNFKQKLEENKFFVSQRGNALRLSFNVFNSEDEVAKFISFLSVNI